MYIYIWYMYTYCILYTRTHLYAHPARVKLEFVSQGHHLSQYPSFPDLKVPGKEENDLISDQHSTKIWRVGPSPGPRFFFSILLHPWVHIFEFLSLQLDFELQKHLNKPSNTWACLQRAAKNYLSSVQWCVFKRFFNKHLNQRNQNPTVGRNSKQSPGMVLQPCK